MATQQSTVGFIMEQIAPVKDATARKLFGEYAIYCSGKVVALICNDQLYVKPTAAGRAFLGEAPEAPPYPGAKPCFLISAEHVEDADRLATLIAISAAELPLPKPKARRKP